MAGAGCPSDSMDREQRPIQLLLVEDSEDDAELIRLELARARMAHEARRVDTRDALQQALVSQDWDIVLSDFAMPAFDGMEAFRIVSSADIDLPFVFVSGAIGEERAVAAMRAGARDYVLKGNLKRLPAVISRELGEVQVRRQRRLAEEAAHREGRRLAMAVAASGAGIFEFDLSDAARAHLSERFAEILGFSSDELPATAAEPAWLLERVHPQDRPSVLAEFGRFMAGAAAGFQFEARVARRDGDWISVTLAGKPIAVDSGGRVSQMVGVMVDLSARRHLEEQLRQAQKMEAVGRLAGGVAHDFNNLLTIIFGFGESVSEELEPGSDARADMDEVLSAAHRAAELTGQLLAFSRQHPMQVRDVLPAEVVAGVERMLRRVLGEKITLEVSIDPDSAMVQIDPGALEQVIVNLAVNARDAMPGGGRLAIRCSNLSTTKSSLAAGGRRLPAGRYVVICIEDDGIGMDADTLERIFEPFFTTKASDQGTGLGLSICYGIIDQAGGYMRVTSALGRGSTFEVLLPHVEVGGELTRSTPDDGSAD